MLNSLKHTLTDTANSISGFVGGLSNAAAPAAQTQTNDAAEPDRTRNRTPHTSRSPATTSRRPSVAIDLTSPTRRQTKAFPPRPNHTTGPATSSGGHDSRMDVGSASRRSSGSKATPLPDPRFHFSSKNGMPKPGANHAPQPKNTLTQQTYHAPRGVIKTYGHSNRPGLLDFLDEERLDSRPSKKRRTDNEPTKAISVYDEGDIQETTPRPNSRRSAGSGSIILPGARDPRSEFDRANSAIGPRRKKARNSASHGGAQSAILIVDDDVPDGGSGANPKKLQLQKFNQGVERPRDKVSGQQAHETTSKHFAPAPKMNHSTLPLGASTQRAARRSSNLRDGFSRRPLPDATTIGPWPLKWARAHDFKESRDDISLMSRAFNEYRITSSDPNDVKYEISVKNINRAETDHGTRIRLIGSTNAATNVQYMVDLDFEDEKDLTVFAGALANSITSKAVHVKHTDFMGKIFEKPLPATSQSSNTELSPSGRSQVQQNSQIVNAKPRLLDNLGVVSSKASSSAAKDPIPAETRRLSDRPVRSTRASRPLTLDVGDFEDTPEVERFSEIHGLGPPWKKSLNYNSGRRRAVVDFQDLERLDDGQFLNDQLIDFYLLYLFDQAKVPRDKVYLFNTHFFTTLTRKVPAQKGTMNYQGVARWTAKEDIFGYDYIVVPINQDIHWYLAIICNVSNIARTPAIDDLTKSDEVGPAAPKRPDGEIPGQEAKTEELTSIPPPALVDPPSEPSTPHAGIEVIDPDDSDLNLVDPRATGSYQGLSAPSGSSSAAESPAAETAQMRKLTLSDSKPASILPSSTPSAGPKKTRRRLGPLPKKRDPNEPVIIVLDSLGGSAKTPAVKVLKDYMAAEGREKRGMDVQIANKAFYAKEGQIPQQQNYVDCGVYLLGYAQQFFEDPDLFKNRLLSNEMQVEAHWPDMAMSSMRAGMRDILQRLNREQEAERDEARRKKKQEMQEKKASPDATVEPAKDSVEQKTTVAEQAETSNSTTEAKETTPSPEATYIAKPSTLSNTQPPSRLASPFQAQPSQRRDRSRSKSIPAPLQTDALSDTRGKVTPGINSQEASSTIEVPRRSGSPMVLIQFQMKKSPKRPRESILVGDSPEETTKKKVRTDVRSPKDFMDGSPRIVGIRSPEPKAARRHEKTSTLQIVSMPTGGSSRDPIQLDESQEAPTATEATPQDVSQESDFIIRSPTSATRTGLPSTRKHLQHMSSPARPNVRRGSPMRRRETRSANESPDPIIDLDDIDALPQRIRGHVRSSRSNGSKWRPETSDEDMAEKTMEVPETPPHE